MFLLGSKSEAPIVVASVGKDIRLSRKKSMVSQVFCGSYDNGNLTHHYATRVLCSILFLPAFCSHPIEVSVGDEPCHVKSGNRTSITCELDACLWCLLLFWDILSGYGFF